VPGGMPVSPMGLLPDVPVSLSSLPGSVFKQGAADSDGCGLPFLWWWMVGGGGVFVLGGVQRAPGRSD